MLCYPARTFCHSVKLFFYPPLTSFADIIDRTCLFSSYSKHVFSFLNPNKIISASEIVCCVVKETSQASNRSNQRCWSWQHFDCHAVFYLMLYFRSVGCARSIKLRQEVHTLKQHVPFLSLVCYIKFSSTRWLKQLSERLMRCEETCTGERGSTSTFCEDFGSLSLDPQITCHLDLDNETWEIKKKSRAVLSYTQNYFGGSCRNRMWCCKISKALDAKQNVVSYDGTVFFFPVYCEKNNMFNSCLLCSVLIFYFLNCDVYIAYQWNWGEHHFQLKWFWDREPL